MVFGVGLIGCGNIARTHFECIKKTPGLKLVAVSDIIPERAQKAGIANEVDFYSDNKKLLERSDVDLVAICTPIATHTDIAKLALSYGKNILIEKPVGSELSKIDDLIKARDKSGKKAFVVHQVRFNETVQCLKQAIDSGKMGKIFAADMILRWFRPESYFSSEWFGKKAIAGATILNQGIHYVDIVQYLIGMPSEVIGVKRNLRYKNIEIEDFSSGIFFYDNGSIARFEANVLTYDQNFECSLTVLGENGTIKIGGKALHILEHWNVQAFPEPILQKIASPNIYKEGLYQGSVPNHLDVYKNCVLALNNKPYVLPSLEESRKSVKLALVLLESAENGSKKIKIKD